MAPALGNGFTVTGCVATAEPQLAVTVYIIVSTPADTPVTMLPLTVAIEVLLLLHVPPGAMSVKAMAEPTHTVLAPVIVPAVRYGPMFTLLVVEKVPQTLVTL